MFCTCWDTCESCLTLIIDVISLPDGDLPLLLEGKQISYGSLCPVNSGRENFVWHKIHVCIFEVTKGEYCCVAPAYIYAVAFSKGF